MKAFIYQKDNWPEFLWLTRNQVHHPAFAMAMTVSDKSKTDQNRQDK